MKLARRTFLKSVAAVTGTGPLMPELMTGVAAASTVAAVGARAQQRSEATSAEKQSSPALGYESLGPDEVDFVEAMVNVPSGRLNAERRRLRTCDIHRPAARRRLRQGREALHARPV